MYIIYRFAETNLLFLAKVSNTQIVEVKDKQICWKIEFNDLYTVKKVMLHVQHFTESTDETELALETTYQETKIA